MENTSFKGKFGLTSRMIKPPSTNIVLWLMRLILYVFGLSRFFTFKRGDYRMRAWKDTFSFWLWAHQKTVRADEKVISALLRKGDVVVDCGANVGLITLLAWSIVGDSGRVYSFEPHPKTYAKLIGNIKLNRFSVSYTECAGIGKEKSKTYITNHFVSDINRVDEEGKIAIALHALDDVVPQHLRVRLLKIDIEGYELFGLLGGVKTLARTDAILVEINEKAFAHYGYTSKELLTLLQDEGFTLYKIERDGTCVLIDTSYVSKDKYEDVLATRILIPESLEKRG